MKTRVLLFGASQGGRQTLGQIGKQTTIVGFLDNDPQKQGESIEGHNIYAPSEIKNLDFELILISSMYVDEIRAQLMKLGIEKERIQSGFLYSNATPPFPWDAALFLVAIAFLAIVASILLLYWIF